MNLKNIFIALVFIGVVGLALAGMFRKPTAPEAANLEEVSESSLIKSTTAESPTSIPDADASGEVREFASILDEEGAVTVEVKPLNLENPSNMLDFEITLNTHSVDLSMNLAALATLTTDTGKVIQAITWDAPQGGHHVSGTLSFPAIVDGVSVLDGASKITLTLINVDAPERVFTWER